MRAFVNAVSMSLLLTLAACGSEESRRITSTCEAVQRHLGLSDEDEANCRRDEAYRKSVIALRDETVSRDLTQTHNRDLRVMLPWGGVGGSYVRVSRLADLPLKGIVNSSDDREAMKHVGERYVIAGTLEAMSDEQRKSVSVSLFAEGGDDPKEFVMLSAAALDEYQKEFVGRHCWVNMGRRSSSMCRGDIYISVRRDPNGILIEQVLDGALLASATDAAVLGRLSTP